MNAKELDAFATSTAKVLVEIAKPLKLRLDAAEQEIATLKAAQHLKFCGTWKAGTTYEPGDAATHHGGLWVCKAATSGCPGVDFIGWVLAVKKGHAV